MKEAIDVAKILIPGWRCERCGHEWVARQEWEDKPNVCSRCKSPYWASPRKTLKKKGDTQGDTESDKKK